MQKTTQLRMSSAIGDEKSGSLRTGYGLLTRKINTRTSLRLLVSMTITFSIYAIIDENFAKLKTQLRSNISDIYSKEKNIPVSITHKYTWTLPNGITQDQIDHFPIDKRRQLSITDTRSLRGGYFDTEHYAMVATIRERLPAKKGISIRCY